MADDRNQLPANVEKVAEKFFDALFDNLPKGSHAKNDLGTELATDTGITTIQSRIAEKFKIATHYYEALAQADLSGVSGVQDKTLAFAEAYARLNQNTHKVKFSYEWEGKTENITVSADKIFDDIKIKTKNYSDENIKLTGPAALGMYLFNDDERVTQERQKLLESQDLNANLKKMQEEKVAAVYNNNPPKDQQSSVTTPAPAASGVSITDVSTPSVTAPQKSALMLDLEDPQVSPTITYDLVVNAGEDFIQNGKPTDLNDTKITSKEYKEFALKDENFDKLVLQVGTSRINGDIKMSDLKTSDPAAYKKLKDMYTDGIINHMDESRVDNMLNLASDNVDMKGARNKTTAQQTPTATTAAPAADAKAKDEQELVSKKFDDYVTKISAGKNGNDIFETLKASVSDEDKALFTDANKAAIVKAYTQSIALEPQMGMVGKYPDTLAQTKDNLDKQLKSEKDFSVTIAGADGKPKKLNIDGKKFSKAYTDAKSKGFGLLDEDDTQDVAKDIYDNNVEKLGKKSFWDGLSEKFKDNPIASAIVEFLKGMFDKKGHNVGGPTPTVHNTVDDGKSSTVLISDLAQKAAGKSHSQMENYRNILRNEVFRDEIKFVKTLGDTIDELSAGDKVAAVKMRGNSEVQDFINKTAKRGDITESIDMDAVNLYVSGKIKLEDLNKNDRSFAKEYKEAMDAIKTLKPKEVSKIDAPLPTPAADVSQPSAGQTKG